VICLQDEEKDKGKEGEEVVFIPPQGEESGSPVRQYFALCQAEGSLLTHV
jgi:hypothetical protein